jgi:hypothetical protein
MASFAIFSRTLLTTRPESSYGILCHLQPSSTNYSEGIVTRNCPIGTANRQPTNFWSLLWTWLATTTSSYIACGQTTKKTPPKIPLLLHDVIAGTDHKENRSSFDCWVRLRCYATSFLCWICWPTACTSQYWKTNRSLPVWSFSSQLATKMCFYKNIHGPRSDYDGFLGSTYVTANWNKIWIFEGRSSL